MTKKLNTYVHAVERNDKGEITQQGVFGPDDDLSKPENAWVEKAITNPHVWDDGDQGDATDASDQSSSRRSTSSRKPTQ